LRSATYEQVEVANAAFVFSDERSAANMMKRKLATVLSGTAMLGTLAFAPLAGAEDAVVVERSVPDSRVTIVEPVAPGSQVIVEPSAMSPNQFFSPNESQIHYGYATARQPGSVPSPYGDMPGSGHVGDEWYAKQQGGTQG
jgi:hypothetical protein